jgi:hypothetical protein
MIWNIIDGRARRYRWAKINAVIEDVAHDNACADSDQAEVEDETSVLFDERRGISLHEAVVWAESQPGRVTLYLYDQGTGIE